MPLPNTSPFIEPYKALPTSSSLSSSPALPVLWFSHLQPLWPCGSSLNGLHSCPPGPQLTFSQHQLSIFFLILYTWESPSGKGEVVLGCPRLRSLVLCILTHRPVFLSVRSLIISLVTCLAVWLVDLLTLVSLGPPHTQEVLCISPASQKQKQIK